MRREQLGPGLVRVSARQISFVFARLRPGLVAVLGAGTDRGDLGAAPVAELERELARFPVPTQVFVDASQVQLVGLRAQDVWTAWLRRCRPRLRGMHVRVASRHVGLSVSVARHHSGLTSLLWAHESQEEFEAALAGAAGDHAWRIDPSWLTAPAARIERAEGAGLVTLADDRCTATLRRLAPVRWLVRIEGVDRGVVSDAIFDELLVAQREGPLELFFDLRAAAAPSIQVSDLWTAWLSSNRAALSNVVLLADRRPLHVTVSIAGVRSHTGSLVRVTRDARGFEREAMGAAAGF